MKRSLVVIILAALPFVVFSQINWYDQEIISADATVKEQFPDQNFNDEAETDDCGRTWKRLYVRDTVNESQETFLKVDISGLAAYITRSLRLRGTQNNESTHPFLIEVYGSRDVSWTESAITWNNSRNIEMTEQPVAWYDVNLHSWSGTYVNFKDNGLHEYINAALADGDESITLILKSKAGDSKNTLFFYSREQDMAFWCDGGADMWDQLPKPTIRSSASSFQQEADASVRESVPDANYGKDNSLDILLSSFGENRKSYVRFNLKNMNGFVSGTSIHFQGKQASGSQDPYNIAVYSTVSDWHEDTITWNNAPEPHNSALAMVNVNTNQKKWWEFSGNKLTEVVNSAILLGVDSVSFVLASTSAAFAEVWFQSRELDDACGIEFQFTPATVNPPVISPASGSDFEDSLLITIEADGADRIYYTLDGSQPTALDMLYTEPLWIKQNTSISARAFSNGYPSVDFTSETYAFSNIYVSPVTIDPAGGTYTDSVLIHLAGEQGAALYYTTNGTTPDNQSNAYNNPFWIYDDTEIKAVAYMNGFYSNEVTTASFFVDQSVGIYENKSNVALKIYPNPVSDALYLKIDEKADYLKVIVTNVTGQAVQSKSAEGTDGMNISFESLPEGIYTLVVYKNSRWYGIKKIIKK